MANAVESVYSINPNARDYYVQGDSAFTQARKEHEARLAALKSVLADLNQILEHIEG
jgi:hypothetical protein